MNGKDETTFAILDDHACAGHLSHCFVLIRWGIGAAFPFVSLVRLIVNGGRKFLQRIWEMSLHYELQ